MIERFSDKQLKVLKALAAYKFLTYKQMITLGIENHSSNLSTLVAGLIKKKKSYIQKIPHRPGIPAKFYLTKRGANILIDHGGLKEEDIHYPKSKITTDTQDQKHRTGIIDLHISLVKDSSAEKAELLICDRYFDTVGSNRINRNLKSKTALPYDESKSLKADMITMLKTPLQKELYIIELENGKDSKKSITKCFEHAKVLFQGSVHDKYNFKLGYRTLWVFEHQSTMHSTLSSIQQDSYFELINEYFLFNTFDSASSSFFSGWVNINNKEKKLFYI